MSIAIPATNYLHCGSFQIPQSGGSILLWQTLRTHDEKMFLTQKVCQPSKIVMGVRVRFKEARIHNRVVFSQRGKKSTIHNTVKSWKSQGKKIYSTNNFCHFIAFFKSTTEENGEVLLWIYSNTFVSVSCPENAGHRKVEAAGRVSAPLPPPRLPIVQSPFQLSRFW